MKSKFTLIYITLMISLVGTIAVFAQRVPQGHVSAAKESKSGIPSSDSGIRLYGTIKYSPDGKMFAALNRFRREFTFYDAQNGDALESSALPPGISCFAFSPDSKLLATGSYSTNVRVWRIGDVDAGVGLHLWYDSASFLFGHKSVVTCLEFSPDGKQIASGSYDRTVRVWDVASGKHLLTIKGGMKAVSSLAYSPDGSMIAAGSWGKAYLWDAKTGGRLLAFDQRGAMRSQIPTVTALTFSPDGKVLITGNSGGAVHSWRVGTGEHLRRIINTRGRNHHFATVNRLTYSPDGNTLACISSMGKIYLWDVSTQKEPKILDGSDGDSMAFSPDGNTIAVAGSSVISFWDINTGNKFGIKDIRTRYELEDR